MFLEQEPTIVLMVVNNDWTVIVTMNNREEMVVDSRQLWRMVLDRGQPWTVVSDNSCWQGASQHCNKLLRTAFNKFLVVNFCACITADKTIFSTDLKSSFKFQSYIEICFHFKARREARIVKRKHMVEQLFDFWDVDRSGTLNFEEVIDVLSKWKDISAQPQFKECKRTYLNLSQFLLDIILCDTVRVTPQTSFSPAYTTPRYIKIMINIAIFRVSSVVHACRKNWGWLRRSMW